MPGKEPSEMTDEELYQALRDLDEYRRSDGRGRSPEAAYVRDYVREEKRWVKGELKRRGLPTTKRIPKAPAGQEWQANFNW